MSHNGMLHIQLGTKQGEEELIHSGMTQMFHIFPRLPTAVLVQCTLECSQGRNG